MDNVSIETIKGVIVNGVFVGIITVLFILLMVVSGPIDKRIEDEVTKRQSLDESYRTLYLKIKDDYTELVAQNREYRSNIANLQDRLIKIEDNAAIMILAAETTFTVLERLAEEDTPEEDLNTIKAKNYPLLLDEIRRFITNAEVPFPSEEDLLY